MKLSRSTRSLFCLFCWATLSVFVLRPAELVDAQEDEPLAQLREEPAGDRYAVFFELTAEVRSRRFDADIEASARLEAILVDTSTEDGAAGAKTLRLVRKLQPATKYYRVDPAGPMGDEAKMAAEVTLPEGSWDALERARRGAERLGQATHEEWSRKTGETQAFDGAFAFIILGEPTDRFQVHLDPAGRVKSVENRLTDRWQNGPFDRFIGGWGANHPEDGSLAGYWFWNEGEAEPFDYEPHVYHAFEQALELLGQALPAGDQQLSWPELTQDLLRVLKTLVPKAERRIEPPQPSPTTLTLVQPGVATSAHPGAQLVSLRRSAEASSLEVTLRDEGLLVELRVGFEALSVQD